MVMFTSTVQPLCHDKQAPPFLSHCRDKADGISLIHAMSVVSLGPRGGHIARIFSTHSLTSAAYSETAKSLRELKYCS